MTEIVSDSPLSRHRTLALVLLGVLLYVPFLGLRDMWYPDEPDIGEVCQAMYVSGDWIAPRRMGEIWVDYPPMLYWAGTLFAHLLGGISAFALRLPNALAAIGLAVMTASVGTRMFDARTGLWAGFLLLTFQQYAYQAVSYRPDVLFSLAIAAGLFLYARGAGERPSGLLRVAGFAMLGLAMLAKGPLGLLLPGLVLTLWHGSRREWRRLLELAPLSVVAMAVYLPWFVACANAMGADSILYELYAQNFERFLAGARGHEKPLYYYLTNIWIDLAPWSPFLPFAIVWVLRGPLRRDRNVQLALWWFAAFFVFLSVAVTKRQLYLLPAYPAIALLLAPWIARVGRADVPAGDTPDPRPVRLYGAALGVALPIVAVLLFVVTGAIEPIIRRLELDPLETEVAHGMRLPLVVLGLTVLAAGLWVGQAWRKGDSRAILVRLGLAHVPLYLVFLGAVLPAMNPTKTYRPQSLWIREQIGPSESHIGLVYPVYGGRKFGAFGLYTGALVDWIRGPGEFERFFRERPGEIVTGDEDAWRAGIVREIDRFFREHPGSVVLIHESVSGEIFSGDEPAWRARTVREVQTGRDRYVVVRAP